MRLRSPVFGLLIVLVTAGCTHIALERRTLQQASTITDLQYQQVLDNLAVFACNPEAIAWHLKLQGGVVQVTDQGSGQLGAQVISGLQLGPTVTPLFGGQRSVVTQWSGSPAVDSDDLELLSLAYQRVTKIDDKEVQRVIRQKIWEQATTYNFFPPSEVLLDIMQDAVDTKFEDMDKVMKVAGEGTPQIESIRMYLSNAQSAFKQIIDMQRLGERDKADYGPNNLKHLAKIKDIRDNLTIVEGLIPEAIKTIRGSTDGLSQIKRDIHIITDINQAFDHETIVYITAHLNPFISRHLVELEGVAIPKKPPVPPPGAPMRNPAGAQAASLKGCNRTSLSRDASRRQILRTPNGVGSGPQPSRTGRETEPRSRRPGANES